MNRFLTTPDALRWGIKSAERNRRHVEQMVKRHRCDLDLTTETRGRPYTLACTRNQDSYERRMRQRQQDLEHRALLDD